jgi:REP element-mobilizing transposase RayT
MARHPRLFAAAVLYHLYCGKRLSSLYRTARAVYDYVLHAYCLMPDHVHLLVESFEHPLAKFMQGPKIVES